MPTNDMDHRDSISKRDSSGRLSRNSTTSHQSSNKDLPNSKEVNAASTSETQSIPLTVANDADIEKQTPTLTRTLSGPPYSIFSPSTKGFIVAAVSISALISPFGATLYYPALNILSKQLHVSDSLITLSITTYMIAQAVAPALIAGMSDSHGRRLSFIICFVIYILANIGLALQTNFAALLVLRCVQAAGCSAAIALSIAVVADIATSADRGKYMGYATAGILVGPAFGPTIGGVLADSLGWRSIFWFLVIFSGVLLVIFVFFFPETSRAVVGNGSIPAHGVNQSILGYLHQRKSRNDPSLSLSPSQSHDQTTTTGKPKRKLILPNPLRTLKIIREKESALILFYNGFFFTGLMVVTSSLPSMLGQYYGLNSLQIGLCFIAVGMGCLVSALTMGHAVDWNFRRHAKRLNVPISKTRQQDLSHFPIETTRLQVVLIGHVVGTLAIITYGWLMKYRVYLAGPEIVLFFIGFGFSTAFNPTNTLLIDLHRENPASATAAVNFSRCLISAGGVAAIVPMIEAMGPGWCFTFIGLVYVVLILAPLWIMKSGQRWREEAAEKKKEKLEREREVADGNRTEK